MKVRSSSEFLNWIKGLVNPLQNIPIISGIYSSINSDKPDSDRDLVQSSAGGFIYGGPRVQLLDLVIGFSKRYLTKHLQN